MLDCTVFIQWLHELSVVARNSGSLQMHAVRVAGLMLVLVTVASSALLPVARLSAMAKHAKMQFEHSKQRGATLDGAGAYPYQTLFYTQRVDHFSFHDSSATYPMKYLINTQFWTQPNAPIFFYTVTATASCLPSDRTMQGNEGPIELFAANTGFQWQVEQQCFLVALTEPSFAGRL
jgi:hypothetical protein